MNTDDERICCIALNMLMGSNKRNPVQLVRTVGSAATVLKMRGELQDIVPGITPKVLEMLSNADEALKRAESEMEFIEKNKIQCLTYGDEAYPSRLRECEDAPIVLFFKGNLDFNRLHFVSIVGTRRITPYGKLVTDELVRELAAGCLDIVIVSGLAYGVDIRAHRAALANGLPTVAVLAHGLDRIYPYMHRDTAVKMLDNGGLLTEFLPGTSPERYNFVSRNRIVAGLSDATIVVESAAKGGSLITAELAADYSRDCFAIPGRPSDEYSAGCNNLIRDNKAGLINSADDFLQAMGWATEVRKTKDTQLPLFPQLNEDEKLIVSLLSERGDLHVNTIVVASGMPVGKVTSLLFELEMKGVVRQMVGGMYHLLA